MEKDDLVVAHGGRDMRNTEKEGERGDSTLGRYFVPRFPTAAYGGRCKDNACNRFLSKHGVPHEPVPRAAPSH